MRIKTVVGIILILLLPIGLGAQDLKIISENNPPFNFVKHGKLTGSSMEIVREMLRRMNRTDTIEVLTWARGYNLALSHFSTSLLNKNKRSNQATAAFRFPAKN